MSEELGTDLTRPWQRPPGERNLIASVGGGLGLPIIGKLLGHTQATTTARYAHLDADPLRCASERIGLQISKAMGDGPSASAEIKQFGSQ